MRRAIAPLLAAAGLVGALPVRAHVLLLSPVSRYGAEMKFAPCGLPGGERTANVTTFRPGQTITVVFDEIIQHPGYFRIAFDASGDDDLAPPDLKNGSWENRPNVTVLQDDIPNAPGGSLTHGEVAVRLPDIECDRCTLQLIQIMTDKLVPVVGDDDFYFQCADLVLSSTAPLGGPAVQASPVSSAEGGGGCASVARRASPPGSIAALLPVLALRRRRAPGRRAGGRTGSRAAAPGSAGPA